MKICPKCGAQLPDNVGFCTTCGTGLGAAQQVPAQQPQQGQYQQPQQPQQGQYQQPQQPQYQQQFNAYTQKPTDHTAEFDAKDISDNKVVAMLPYLLSFIGVIIALLGANDSKYAAFHVRQALKILVCQIIVYVVGAIIPFLGWFLILPVGSLILLIVTIISFFSVCKGNAKEPAIISNFGFLK